jgi:hypothetical protein
MKHAARILLVIVGAVGLSACESLPVSDSLDQGEPVPTRAEALSKSYLQWRSELGAQNATIERMFSRYSYYQ